MATYEMSDGQCEIAEVAGMNFAQFAGGENLPLHIVRECLIKGFDERAAELLSED